MHHRPSMRHVRSVSPWALAALVPAALLLGDGCEVTDLEGPSAQAQEPEAEEPEAEEPEAAPEQEMPTALGCFVEIRRRGTVSQQQAYELCRGSRSTGPVQCFREARKKTVLQDWLRIQLCRCAQGTAPVRCYRRYRDNVVINNDLVVVDQCRPIVSRKLTDNCIPIRSLL